MHRNYLYRKKIIGGSILGNVWDAAKNIISVGSKMALDKGKELLRLGTSKALETGKELMKEQAENVKELVKSKASDLAQRGVQSLVCKTKSIGNKLTPEMRENIKTIATNPKVRKVLTDKTKQVLAKTPLNEQSRAILSNIIMGNGVKRLR